MDLHSAPGILAFFRITRRVDFFPLMRVEGGMAEFPQSRNWKRLEDKGENHLLSSVILSRVSEVIREFEMNLPKGEDSKSKHSSGR